MSGAGHAHADLQYLGQSGQMRLSRNHDGINHYLLGWHMACVREMQVRTHRLLCSLANPRTSRKLELSRLQKLEVRGYWRKWSSAVSTLQGELIPQALKHETLLTLDWLSRGGFPPIQDIRKRLLIIPLPAVKKKIDTGISYLSFETCTEKKGPSRG